MKRANGHELGATLTVESVDDGPEQMNSKFAPLLGKNLGRAREIIHYAIFESLY